MTDPIVPPGVVSPAGAPGPADTEAQLIAAFEHARTPEQIRAAEAALAEFRGTGPGKPKSRII